ncbi:MAG: hypothetical protein KOO63_06080 [Bacteroidales bacterium]|nr:hypothetical protein [Candidatus Latescibacterota bacterium]
MMGVFNGIPSYPQTAVWPEYCFHDWVQDTGGNYYCRYCGTPMIQNYAWYWWVDNNGVCHYENQSDQAEVIHV